ncbi:MAG: hypothetical protein BWK80_26740 [Desulfobacteraceae bacterium IS3]|nr:MAG: hypothetical protein BWK80_26740 [Desulfobacteraceae bacterium IS3]HAO22892.1 DUF2442 domain-containing protein [Desulfobacteraceae bacterium]
MLLEVKSAKYDKKYRIALCFNDGYEAMIDLENILMNESRSVFQPLRSQEYFKTFSVKFNTICWDNEADFAPEFLYDLAKNSSLRR